MYAVFFVRTPIVIINYYSNGTKSSVIHGN